MSFSSINLKELRLTGECGGADKIADVVITKDENVPESPKARIFAKIIVETCERRFGTKCQLSTKNLSCPFVDEIQTR